MTKKTSRQSPLLSTALSSFTLAAIVSAIHLFCSSTASAGTIVEGPTLADLINGNGAVINGDKVFTDFAYSRTNDMPMAENVRVNSIVDTDGNLGIQFQGGFKDLPGDGGSDALVTYRVRSTTGKTISGAHLESNPVAPGNGFFGIVETFFPPFDPAVVQLNIRSDVEPLSGIAWQQFERPVGEILVKKNILFQAGESAVTASYFDQTFEQIPEPSSVLLMMFGAVLLTSTGIRPSRMT